MNIIPIYRAHRLAWKPSRRHSVNGSSTVAKGTMAFLSWANLCTGEGSVREGKDGGDRRVRGGWEGGEE